MKKCLEQCLAHCKCSVNVSHCSYFCSPECRSCVSLVCFHPSPPPAGRVNQARMAWRRTVLVPSSCQPLVSKGAWFATLAAFERYKDSWKFDISFLGERRWRLRRAVGAQVGRTPAHMALLPSWCLCTWVIAVHSGGSGAWFCFWLHWADLLYICTGLIVKS